MHRLKSTILLFQGVFFLFFFFVIPRCFFLFLFLFTIYALVLRPIGFIPNRYRSLHLKCRYLHLKDITAFDYRYMYLYSNTDMYI